MPPEQTSPTTSYNTTPRQSQSRLKIVIALVVVMLLTILLLAWLTQSRSVTVTVNVESDSVSKVTYRFVEQDSQDVTEVKNAGKNIQTELAVGNYELTVVQDQTNFFAVLDVDDEMTVNAKPLAEKGRRFIGNRPDACLHTVSGVLLSYACGGSFDGIQTHVPATAGTPTAANRQFTGDAIAQRFAHTAANQDLLLVQEIEDAGHVGLGEGEIEHSPYSVFAVHKRSGVGASMEVVESYQLPDLRGNEQYSMVAYKEGFLAFNRTFNRALYYAAPDAKPVELTIGDTPENSNPYSLSARGNEFMIAYSEGNEREGVVVVHNGNSRKSFPIPETLSPVVLCGKQKLCGVTDNQLAVYDLTTEEPTLLYRINSVKNIASFGNQNDLAVARNKDVISLNVETRQGSIQYSYGQYVGCGIQPADDSYLVCITNNRGDSSILAIDQAGVSDRIDQKVASLVELPEVEVVSAYGNFIFISPEAGELVFREDLEGFGYDQAKLDKANAAISKAVQELGLDDSEYQVKNTLE